MSCPKPPLRVQTSFKRFSSWPVNGYVFGKQSFSAFFKKVTSAETWLRRITGGSILAVGIYITVQQIYLS